MTANTYTRSVSILITELVPENTMLPRCHGWKVSGKRCAHRARYELDGRPVCAQHVSPKAMLVPEKWVRE